MTVSCTAHAILPFVRVAGLDPGLLFIRGGPLVLNYLSNAYSFKHGESSTKLWAIPNDEKRKNERGRIRQVALDK